MAFHTELIDLVTFRAQAVPLVGGNPRVSQGEVVRVRHVEPVTALAGDGTVRSVTILA